ncbi:MAG: hypothetical protein HOK65_09480, partial [Crocinitomicaceae bacterium]|nr:hypothetical protein [Crocinitomicaceae bacterium]
NPLDIIENGKESNREIVRIVDVMGREIDYENGVIMLFQYSDGSVEKKVVLK